MKPRHLAAALTSMLLALTACGGDTDASEDAKAPSAETGSSEGGELSFRKAVKRLSAADEERAGYDRDRFEHWIDENGNGCDTRAEVLLTEATKRPKQVSNCRLEGGSWRSYYDGKTVRDASELDIDHMVPLAEAWASGAKEWTDDKRKRFANDLEAGRTLVAVTASSNRSKSDKDPGDWLPPESGAHCRYGADWTATKLRWGLSADQAEKEALTKLSRSCANTTVSFSPAS